MQQFPDMLRHWRSQRRFSQLDLALEANVSARHISFLETGRSRPSRDMVVHLGDTLAIPFEVRNQMLASAGFAAKYQDRDWDDAAMAPIKKAIDWTLKRHAPYPGIALDRLWVIQNLNAPAKALFGSMGLGVGSSMLEMVQNPLIQASVENWPEVAHHTALRLRSESTAQGGVPVLDAAANAIAQDAIPSEASVPAVPTIFRMGDQRLSLFGTIAQFGTTADQTLEDLKIELFFPADDAAEVLLNQLAGGT